MNRENALLSVLLTGVVIGLVVGAGVFVALFPQMTVPQAAAPNAPLDSNTGLSPLSPSTYSARIAIVAVQEQDNSGVTNTALVEVQPGRGRVLVALNPFVEPDTQQSAETAKVVAERYTKTDLSGFDLIYSIDSNATLVGGPSAGAALTVATIAAIQQKTVRDDAAITGTIEADGTIGQIGGVLEKTQAVAASGKKLFLIPKGQGKILIYEPKTVVEQRGPFQIQRTTYETKQLDLIAYAKGELGLEVREVAAIDDAVKALLQ
jgi:uncharacterized protein